MKHVLVPEPELFQNYTIKVNQKVWRILEERRRKVSVESEHEKRKIRKFEIVFTVDISLRNLCFFSIIYGEGLVSGDA
jgi:hypothetical protein